MENKKTITVEVAGFDQWWDSTDDDTKLKIIDKINDVDYGDMAIVHKSASNGPSLPSIISLNRFFLVSYQAESSKSTITGCVNIRTDSKGLNYKSVKEYISSKNIVFLKCIVITNILEVSEKDYNEWIRE